jgi:hypothetical protein
MRVISSHPLLFRPESWIQNQKICQNEIKLQKASFLVNSESGDMRGESLESRQNINAVDISENRSLDAPRLQLGQEP